MGPGRQHHSRLGGEAFGALERRREEGTRERRWERKVLVFPAVASRNLTLLLTREIYKKKGKKSKGRREEKVTENHEILCPRVCGNAGPFF